MNKRSLKKIGVGISLGFMLLPFLALAAAQVPVTPLISSPTDISNIISRTFNWVAGIVMTIALIMLLWAAILYLTAGGSEDRLKRAKTTLIYAIVGIAVGVLAFSIQPFLETFFRGGFG
jgi:membrane-associated HD superfamily phosphohydrolase